MIYLVDNTKYIINYPYLSANGNTASVTERPYFYDVALCDKLTKEIFYDKLGYKMISLPLFNKQPEELKTVMDQWLYLLKHLSTMDRLPSFLDKRIFGLIFEIGEIGKLTEEELMSYEASLKHKRDAESVFNSAKKSGEALGHAKGLAEGKAKGLAEGERKKALETAKAFKEMGLPIADIAKGTGLSVEEVEKL
ncbi:PD-(D/E)XK nuclease family transposase [Sphingobacterium siyangense]|uniref:PD-(D/E)XK nuclease family transposase n=1 Tax=Sphingobacterium siyangense TaxID=459529 RepID=UPI00289CB236|nr:PD-(D/E)XK nuclease family transposase [Sphingobacterium siyangense]